MYHGTAENQKSKKKIVEALFLLMKRKSFSEITATDIIRKADVARATYYRNFDKKEDILNEFMEELRRDISLEEHTDNEELFAYENVVNGFEKALNHFLQKKSYVLTLYEKGFGTMIQDTMNRYVEEYAGEMSFRSPNRYLLYFVSGASTNILLQWLSQGAEESPHEIATICANIMSKPIIK
jgi:AcrR family transcriptional regulator